MTGKELTSLRANAVGGGGVEGVEFLGKTVKNMYSINTKRSCLKYINIQLKTNIIHCF